MIHLVLCIIFCSLSCCKLSVFGAFLLQKIIYFVKLGFFLLCWLCSVCTCMKQKVKVKIRFKIFLILFCSELLISLPDHLFHKLRNILDLDVQYKLIFFWLFQIIVQRLYLGCLDFVTCMWRILYIFIYISMKYCFDQ